MTAQFNIVMPSWKEERRKYGRWGVFHSLGQHSLFLFNKNNNNNKAHSEISL